MKCQGHLSRHTHTHEKKISNVILCFLSFGGRGRKKESSIYIRTVTLVFIPNPNIQQEMNERTNKKLVLLHTYVYIRHIIAEICIINIELGKCLRFLLWILLNCTRSSHFFFLSKTNSRKLKRHNARCVCACIFMNMSPGCWYYECVCVCVRL